MGRYALRRMLLFVPTLLMATILVFASSGSSPAIPP